MLDVVFLNIFKNPVPGKMNFVITGMLITLTQAKGFLLSVDFSNFFKRKCVLDDVKKQYLTDLNGQCIMGKRTPYWFKLPNKICILNNKSIFNLKSEVCDCHQKDFLCVDGFKKDNKSNKCVSMKSPFSNLTKSIEKDFPILRVLGIPLNVN
jgi:hypothetical protein